MTVRIHTIGTSTLSRAAEQAVLTLEVSSEGPTQSAVSLEVTTTSNLVQSELKANSSEKGTADPAGSPMSPSPDEATISQWSMSSLSTGSYMPWDPQHKEEQQKDRVYTARTTFEITFCSFDRLGQIVSNLANMPHVSVVNIEWRLTTPTKLEMGKASRKLAIEDAVNKATDYGTALGRTSLKALEVSDTDYGGGVRSVLAYSKGIRHRAVEQQEESLHFTPQNCEVHCSVKVLFEAS
jgi:uncharacterized protein YggE